MQIVCRDRDVWKQLAGELRVREARMSGTLCDLGDVPSDPLDGLGVLASYYREHRSTRSSGAAPDDVRQMARWITDCVAARTSRGSWRDHACSRCMPNGPSVIAGFRCAVHIAEDALRNSTGFTSQAPEKKT
jgi:hypothetical protein